MKTLDIGWCIVAVALVLACDRNVTYTTDEQEPATCFNCHSDENTQLVAAQLQWEHSVHGSSANTNRSTAPCNGCHTSEGFKMRIETWDMPALVENPTAIHCFTCHAPHTNGDFRLRVQAAQALQNGFKFDVGSANLCVSCHHARENVDTYVKTESGQVNIANSRWGPHHSVQGDMLFGSNGYEYAGFPYTRTEHRTATENGCVDCHQKFTRNSKVGGHTWNMRWTDEDGELLNTAACVPCHGATTSFDRDGIQTEITTLAEELKGLLIARGLLSASGSAVPGTRTSDEAGAIWNYLLIEEDRSLGVHNPNYMRDLLQSAINFLNPPPPAPGPVAQADARSRDI
jgi:hypothetical protein